MRDDLDVGIVRWIVLTKDGRSVVENHNFGRTWRKVYNDEYGNIEAVCMQVLPEGIKYFATPSPFGLYWTFEDMETKFGGSTKHMARNLCSMQEGNINNPEMALWEVTTIYPNKTVERKKMYQKDIGYSTHH